MASKGYYPLSTSHPQHEIRRASGVRPCWGAEIEVVGFWVAVNAPRCTGSIQPGHLYLVHEDRRDPRHRVNSCLTCTVYYSLSPIEGDLSPYFPMTERDRAVIREDLVRMAEELRQMKAQ